MRISHLIVLIVAILIGMVFAGWLRSLPLLSSLPQY